MQRVAVRPPEFQPQPWSSSLAARLRLPGSPLRWRQVAVAGAVPPRRRPARPLVLRAPGFGPALVVHRGWVLARPVKEFAGPIVPRWSAGPILRSGGLFPSKGVPPAPRFLFPTAALHRDSSAVRVVCYGLRRLPAGSALIRVARVLPIHLAVGPVVSRLEDESRTRDWVATANPPAPMVGDQR